jgi:hypothetical protein
LFSRWTDAELTTATARARTAKQFSKNNNPDAVVEWNNGKQWVVDFKYMPGNGGNLSKRLLEAYEQADYAVVMITGTVNIDAIINMANSFLKNRPSFKMVIIYGSNGELIYKKGNA